MVERTSGLATQGTRPRTPTLIGCQFLKSGALRRLTLRTSDDSEVVLSEDNDSGTFRRVLSSQATEPRQEKRDPETQSRVASRDHNRGYNAVAAATSGPPRGAAISAASAATSRSGSSAPRTWPRDAA